MITALLAQLGLPLLVKAVRTGVAAIDHPLARTATEALDGVDGAIGDGRIPPEQIAESNRHLERMAAIESDKTRTTLEQINRTARAEVRSDDAFVRRWRPTFGYVVALTWTLQMTAIAWVVVTEPARAPAVVEAAASLSMMWGIALGVLGVAVHQRSRDKALRTGAPPSPLDGILKKLAH